MTNLQAGTEITYRGKRYKISRVAMYGGRLMVSGFRWIKTTQKYSSVAYILATVEEIKCLTPREIW